MIEDQIRALSLTLPAVPVPLAAYIPAVKSGNFVFTSGQLPMLDGVLKYKGKVGAEVSEQGARLAAEIAVLNCLSVVKSIIGSLDFVERVIKLTE